jgi:hypothetical protein
MSWLTASHTASAQAFRARLPRASNVCKLAPSPKATARCNRNAPLAAPNPEPLRDAKPTPASHSSHNLSANNSKHLNRAPRHRHHRVPANRRLNAAVRAATTPTALSAPPAAALAPAAEVVEAAVAGVPEAGAGSKYHF